MTSLPHNERQALKAATAALQQFPPARVDAIEAARRRAEEDAAIARLLCRGFLFLLILALLALWIVPVAAEGIGAMVVEAREAEFRG